MPGDYRVGLDENESFGPVVPHPPNDNPEQPIELIQLGAYVSVCKPQVAGEEQQSPLLDYAVPSEMPASTPAWPAETEPSL